MDALMCLSDELAKLDVYTETIMQKVYHYMANTLENNDVAKLPEYSKCNNKVLYIVSRECNNKVSFNSFETFMFW